MTSYYQFKDQLLNGGIMNYPINELDEEYFNQHGKPPSGKYAKMLTRATPIADKIWDQTLTLKSKLHEFEPAIRQVFTNRGIEYMVEQYAALNVELQDLNKELKAAKQEQELLKYMERFENVYTTNAFDMMVNDIEALLPEASKRNDNYQAQYTDSMVDPITYTVDDMKLYFKEETKKYKAKKQEILKRQKQKV